MTVAGDASLAAATSRRVTEIVARGGAVAMLACALLLWSSPPEGDPDVRTAAVVPLVAAILLAGASAVRGEPRAVRAVVVGASVAAMAGIAVVQVSSGLAGPWQEQYLLAALVLATTAALLGYRATIAAAVLAAVTLAASDAQQLPGDALQHTTFVVGVAVLQVLVLGTGAGGALRILDTATRDAEAREVEAVSARVDEEASARAAEVGAELQRLLHDTALNTLEALAAHGDRLEPDDVVARCAADSAVVRRWLDARSLDRSAPSPGSLRDRLHDEAERAARRGLRVDVVEEGAGAEESEALPAHVVDALVGGVREGLLNVSKHAGVAEAVVRLEATGDAVVVEVRDHGRGFDVQRAPLGFGIAESVVDRMAGIGGRATLSSSDEGTVVRLSWAPSHVVDAGDAPAWSPRLARIVLVVGTVVLLLDGVTLLLGWASWTRPAIAVAAWGLPLLWLAWLAAGRRRGREIDAWDVGATLAVYVAAATLGPLADPFCVGPLGEMFGVDGRLVLLAVVVLWRPRPLTVLLAVAAVLSVSVVDAGSWASSWAGCGQVTAYAGVLSCVALVLVWSLGRALDAASARSVAAMAAAAGARARARSRELLAAERAAWTVGTMSEVAELLDDVATHARHERVVPVELRQRCAHLASGLRAILGVGASSRALHRELRPWLSRLQRAGSSVTVRGSVSDLDPPDDVAASIAGVVAQETGLRDVVLLGWRDGETEGLVLTALDPRSGPSHGAIPRSEGTSGPVDQTGDGRAVWDWSWQRRPSSR